MNKTNAGHAITEWNGPFGLPDFGAFHDEDFKGVFENALRLAEEEIKQLVSSGEKPTIENFLVPFELCGEELNRVCNIFFMRVGAHSNEEIQQLERDIAPQLSRFSSRLIMDEGLFSKLDVLYQQREIFETDIETRQVIEETWKRFVRNGARLDTQDKKRLEEINERLAVLGALFGQNILKDNTQWLLYLDKKEELAGLPDDLLCIMSEAAREHGRQDAWAVTLTRAIVVPFLTFSDRRDLREIVWRAWVARGSHKGERDNGPIISEMIGLRDEKAKLLGFSSYSAFKLTDSMAKTPEHVMELLFPVWEKAKRKAGIEKEALSTLVSASGSNDALMDWDWRYYAEKLKSQQYAFDVSDLKPYFQLDCVIQAAFWVANRLFGLIFEEQENIPLWHPDARLWLVKDSDSSIRGLFIGDYFARSSKQSGAWMSSLRDQHKLGGGMKPIVYNICNFAKSGKGQPVLLSLDDAETLFHEFGHALHGLLSNVIWPSISGTSVVRDFVELPSQLYEHWLTVPEVVEKFFCHYKTGTPMPAELLEKVLKARTLNSGFDTVQYLSSALVDMAFHSGVRISDPVAFEKKQLEKLGMPDAVSMMHRSSHFTHVFSGDGYAAGYYSYMWSEVLDVDAFAAFRERGDVFDPVLAAKLKEYIYAAGGSQDPVLLYKGFRGRVPSPKAMIRERGLE